MRRTLARSAGISLIELVVAVTILSIGVVAGYRTLNQSQRVIGGELPRVLAETVALNRAAELRLQGTGAALPEIVDMGGIAWTISVDTAATLGGFVEARIAVTSPETPGATLTVFVPLGPS